MEERKKPERRETGAHERREKGKETGWENEKRAISRANIAGESYETPGKASPAFAPGHEMEKACEGQENEKTCKDEARMMRRANLAGERYESPAKKPELHEPGEKK